MSDVDIFKLVKMEARNGFIINASIAIFISVIDLNVSTNIINFSIQLVKKVFIHDFLFTYSWSSEKDLHVLENLEMLIALKI